MTILKGKKNKQIMNERALEESLNQHAENLKQSEIQHEERIKKKIINMKKLWNRKDFYIMKE